MQNLMWTAFLQTAGTSHTLNVRRCAKDILHLIKTNGLCINLHCNVLISCLQQVYPSHGEAF